MIKKNLSIYLDVLRFGAALVVLLSHFAYPRFTGGRYLFIRDLNLGSDAVVIFFVLSGLVIAFTARKKDKTLRRFTFNRATRLISVAVPAVLLTFVLDRVGSSIDPVVYSGWWYNPLDLGDMLLSGLTFSSEWTGQGTRLGTNGPYWSLSYEVAYYILFGLAIFLKGPLRIALLAVSAMAFGFDVLLLLPAWLVGVWLFHRLQDSTKAPGNPTVLAIGPWIIYALMLAVDVPGFLTAMSESLTSVAAINGLRFSDEFAWNWILAGIFTVHLYGMASWLEGKKMFAVSAIRWLAGASFSLYLVHYPVLQFFEAVLPKSDIWLINDAVLLTLTIAVCLVFAELFERRLKPFRHAIRNVVPFRGATPPRTRAERTALRHEAHQPN